MRLGATLYIHNTVEAVERYSRAFGLTLGYHELFPDGTYLHAALCKDGEEVFAVSESQNNNDAFEQFMLKASLQNARPTMSYGLTLGSADEVRDAFTLLAEDGHVMMPLSSLPWSACCAEVVDKYGVYWYLTV